MRIDAQVDDQEVIDAIRLAYKPEQVFDDYQLREWAESNGYVEDKQS